MSVILAPVYEQEMSEDCSFEDYLHGKNLALKFEELDALAEEHGVCPLGAFYYEDPAILAELAGEDMDSEGQASETPWFEAREGVEAIESLLRILRADDAKSAWALSVDALEQLKKDLEIAARRSIRFNLQARS